MGPGKGKSDRVDPRAATARVVVVGGTRVYREALAAELERTSLFDVLCSGTGSEDLAELEKSLDAIVLLDVSSLGSLLLMPAILGHAHGARVVALGVRETEQDIVACAEAGINAYAFIDASLADLVDTIVATAADAVSLPPFVSRIILGRLAHLPSATNSTLLLTAREIEMVECVRLGLTNKEIARRLGIQVATVKNHMHNILRKLRIHRRTEAASVLGDLAARGQPPT